jgi:hypothetical protein
MQNLAFTTDGFLSPFEKITIDISTFKNVFVDDFPNSTTRKAIFDNYLRYLDDFSKEITPNFTQWIDGSFVTLKENPRDIDFVTFINVDLYNNKEEIIDKFLSFSLENQGLDAYILQIYPKENFLYQSYTLQNIENWSKRFSKTKKNTNGIDFPKGFLEINF